MGRTLFCLITSHGTLIGENKAKHFDIVYLNIYLISGFLNKLILIEYKIDELFDEPLRLFFYINC